MSSILTNDGASIALQTLKHINSGMATVQSEISTGRKVSGSQDNAAVWAIAKTMEADVVGYKQVSASLALGSSTVAVARSAAETVTDLLTEIKGGVVSAQEENVDRVKIQANISALRDQIGAVVRTAQFNGLNLLGNTDTTAGSGSEAVLGFLQRDSAGVRGVDIAVSRQDLGTGAHAIAATGGTYTSGVDSATLNATRTGTIDASGVTVAAGMAFTLNVFGTDADDSTFTQADLRTTTAAAETRAEMAAQPVSYVARDGDTATDVLRELSNRWSSYAVKSGFDEGLLSMSVSGTDLTVSSTLTDGSDTLAVSLNALGADAGNTIGGGLETLASLDVSTREGAEEALLNIENLLQTSISAASDFGTEQNRLATQSNFNDTLVDAMTSGIGTLVDANLEESSARLQALQVQQQLAIQALSIANSAPSALLGLFR
ncbi:flagellin [Salipiger aestuarii]|uniref:Flagellin n=1 Tax=Salipiger aestuarii TaxID=568098 RepID=A0A327Y605_9RHOB|nr:flagellin [Salipiger aestuarii]KAB2542076.1 flagellin [Salipiger aestuarii]RAK16483.1 flagellin [Salipiger aestuarii]